MLVIVAPGQGAQTPGFLAPWLEDPATVEFLRRLSDAAGLDLIRYGTEADAEEIRDTSVAQPLLVAAGLVAAAALFPEEGTLTAATGLLAGHSVGEITAAALAGVLTPLGAIRFVAERGRQMAAASAVQPTSMTAVIGGDETDVLAALAAHGLTPANNNGPGQIVAAGTVAQLEALAADPPAKARLRPLSVAGAFHTVHMEPAVAPLAALADTLAPADPATRLLSNADGDVVPSGADYLARLVRQVANPVRWDLCMRTMAELGVTGLIELAPAGTLTGIAKRHLAGVELLKLNSPDDLAAAHDFVAAHAGAAA
ncbi:ACP S-malonyltransferase [Propionicicella superfundia]|uniref:ACP S-malonyltransferase n=1 Tax=Propionicicella superfundia TaxID=348582 RepID=UPI000415C2D5|nr:ACP S-malonyltransferase [Propionicicella superfundia]